MPDRVFYSSAPEIPEFSQAARYWIQVRGSVDQSWLDRFDGMSIDVTEYGENITISTLQVFLADQAALAGLLNRLYEMHFTILSIELVKSENPASGA